MGSGLPASPRTAEKADYRTGAGAVFYALTIFVSAFLLFEVQPLVGREILPWFGGSASVWTTCMLFFQMLLLAGYGYAHFLATRTGSVKASWIHRSLLILSLITLPIIPSAWWKPHDGSWPLLRILGLLCVTVGVPYFVLAATSPWLQSLYVKERHSGMPYRFFALSNFGSMLALVSYPIVVEPYFPLHVQAWAWSAAYVVFAALCFRLTKRSGVEVAESREARPITYSRSAARTRAMWLSLSACASGLLLAVTNHITQNIAAIPLLWVLPLALYLLSFIICFDHVKWYARPLFLGLFAVAAGSMVYASGARLMLNKAGVLIPIFCAGLFLACMVCHGELARRKPGSEQLTSFYLTIALGGALGGVFVGLVAPALFPALLELPILLIATPAVVLWVLFDDRPAVARTMREQFRRTQFWSIWVGSAACLAIGAGYLGVQEYKFIGNTRLLARNFYGALRVTDEPYGIRQLAHGTITHGEQYLDPVQRRTPITYYSARTGVGMLLKDVAQRGPLRLGVIGLGAGTMAAWGRSGDVVRFYEINPLVLSVARSQFTYLRDCRAAVDVVLGDARLSLEGESPENLDVLVVDAFSGDSIPVHLLTREALAIYWRHLKPNGTLAIHTSNKYLQLGPPLALLAQESHRECHLITNEPNNATETFASDWVLIGTGLEARFPWIASEESEIDTIKGLRPWTDDFSNLWQVLQ